MDKSATAKASSVHFDAAFEKLTGHKPLSWQTRLYYDHFVNGDLPSMIDLSTDLAKTMVMAIWLIARTQQPDKLPARLTYVVDRRTVVDQATDLAKKLQDNYGKLPEKHEKHKLAISTLRGQLADNRECLPTHRGWYHRRRGGHGRPNCFVDIICKNIGVRGLATYGR